MSGTVWDCCTGNFMGTCSKTNKGRVCCFLKGFADLILQNHIGWVMYISLRLLDVWQPSKPIVKCLITSELIVEQNLCHSWRRGGQKKRRKSIRANHRKS